MIFITSF